MGHENQNSAVDTAVDGEVEGDSIDMKKKREQERKAKQEEKMLKFEEKKKKQEAQEKLKEQKEKSLPKETPKVQKATTPAAAIPATTNSPGEKKDLSQPMASAYDPIAVESCWYSWWEKQGYFKPEISGVDPENNPKGKFVMVIPPPNVTGSLHLGHALTNAIQDAITRWHRMCGVTTLWNPGCDHAGIATQVVVEKKLMRERNQSRHDLGREAFIEEIWKWKQQSGDRIYTQLRRLGSSYDWTREVFTMDEKLSRAVTEAFIRLYDEKYIYRSTRLVNWCSVLKTAISNVEVEYKELTCRTKMTVPGHGDTEYEFGVLTDFAYFLDDDSGEIVVSTLRLETMLGDVAVAVHPDDQRYTTFHNKFLKHPLLLNRKIPIITDTMVDPLFATGAVKITPAHDFNDFECGKRHQLPCINVLTEDGCINDCHPEFQGMKRFDARNKMLAMAIKDGWFRGQRDHAVNVPICSRTGDVIEPMMKPQWFVKCDTLSQEACEAVKSGELQIIPNAFEKTWFSWMENLNDWCISRQLWWGHRIPAYKIVINGLELEDSDHWVAAHDEREALQRAKERFPTIDEKDIQLLQDEDVLDTWFSSALFPFSIFGWPENTPDFNRFYPTSLLETGHDILFFWVARMVMLGKALTGKLPFKQVYLHAMIRDAHGRKMSKSLGNVIDPMDVIEGIPLETMQQRLEESNLKRTEITKAKAGLLEDYPEGIPQCGTDALRFALCAYTLQARDISLDVKRIYGYRQFCNKIWNATKFVLLKLGDDFKPSPNFYDNNKEMTLGDRWLLSRLENCMLTCQRGFQQYDFPSVTTAIHSFFLYDFCDVYIELAKSFLNSNDEASRIVKNVLYTCVDCCLRLMSPFMPYITEELYHRLPYKEYETICLAAYPQSTGEWMNESIEKEFELVLQIARSSRSLVADYFKRNQKAHLYVQCKSKEVESLVSREHRTLMSLTRASQLDILIEEVPIGCMVRTVREDCNVFLHVQGLVNVEEEVQKLTKDKNKIQSQIDGLLKLSNMKDYVEKVPESVREANTQKVATLSAEIDVLANAMSNFIKIQ